MGDWGYRWYGPSLARFLSKDPIGERGGINLILAFNNNAISSFDPNGRETYSATDDILTQTPGTTKDTHCGTLTLNSVYVDASLTDTLQNYNSSIYDTITGPISGLGKVPGLTKAKFNTSGFIGSGFMMTYEENREVSCCCTETRWRQSVKKVGIFWDSWKEEYKYNSGTAVDFPGDTYTGWFNRELLQEFKLELLCVNTKNEETIVKEITWSSKHVVNANKKPTSTTVTLTINW